MFLMIGKIFFPAPSIFFSNKVLQIASQDHVCLNPQRTESWSNMMDVLVFIYIITLYSFQLFFQQKGPRTVFTKIGTECPVEVTRTVNEGSKTIYFKIIEIRAVGYQRQRQTRFQCTFLQNLKKRAASTSIQLRICL